MYFMTGFADETSDILAGVCVLRCLLERTSLWFPDQQFLGHFSSAWTDLQLEAVSSSFPRVFLNFFSISKENGLSLNWEWPDQIKEKISLRCRSYSNKYNHCKSLYSLYCNSCLIRSFKQMGDLPYHWADQKKSAPFQILLLENCKKPEFKCWRTNMAESRWVISSYNSSVETVAMRCNHFSWFTQIKNVSVLRSSLSCAVVANQVDWHVLNHQQVWICVGSKNHMAASQWVSPCLPQGVCWERLETFMYQTGISV